MHVMFAGSMVNIGGWCQDLGSKYEIIKHEKKTYIKDTNIKYLGIWLEINTETIC